MRERWLPVSIGMAGKARDWLESCFWRIAAIDPTRWWAALRTREGKAFAAIALAALLFGIADFITMPPPMPSYRQVVADWLPSEAWLYDRHGRLLDSDRVNIAARRATASSGGARAGRARSACWSPVPSSPISPRRARAAGSTSCARCAPRR